MADPIRHIPLSEVMPGISSRLTPAQTVQPQKLDATQEEIIRELNRRRSALTPEQTAIVDELMRRMSPAQPQGPQLQARTPTIGEHATEFFAGMGSKLDPREFLKGAKTVLTTDPRTTARAILEAQGGLVQKSAESLQRGDYLTGTLQSLSAAVPLIGPEFEAIRERATRGGLGTSRAMGEAAGLGTALGLPSTLSRLSRIRLTPPIQNLNPQEAAALGAAVREGAPVPAGTMSGVGAVKAVQKGVAFTPMGALEAARSERGLTGALTGWGTRLAEEAYPAARHVPESAGASAIQAFEKKVADFRTQAGQQYGTWRAAEADPRNIRTVQVGVDPQGAPITKDIGLPVDLRAIKAQFQPVYEQMNRTWSLAKRETSPAYNAVENIIKAPDFEASSVVEEYLGAVKRLAREKEGRVGGMAKNIIPRMQQTIDRSVGSFDPAALQSLRAGRKIRATQAGTQEILDVLKGTAEEPVAAYGRIVQPGDARIRFLRQVNREAPEQVAIAGRAYLEDLMTKATQEGGFKRADYLWSQWRNLGPETKKLLYKNPLLRENIDKFLLASKKIGENPNPSGTATTLIGMGGGIGGLGVLLTEPLTGATYTIGNYALAKLLYSPRGAKLITQGLTLPLWDPKAGASTAAFGQIMKIAGEDIEKLEAQPARQ